MLDAISREADPPFTYLTWETNIPMEDIHPTEEGVRIMLTYLNSRLKEVIWNPDFISTNKKYQGVTSIYRYGCLTCANYIDVEGDFCVSCKPPAADTDHHYALLKRDRDDNSSDEESLTTKTQKQNDGQ